MSFNPLEWFGLFKRGKIGSRLLAAGFVLVLGSFFSDSIRSSIGREAGATFMMLVGLLFVMISPLVGRVLEK